MQHVLGGAHAHDGGTKHACDQTQCDKPAVTLSHCVVSRTELIEGTQGNYHATAPQLMLDTHPEQSLAVTFILRLHFLFTTVQILVANAVHFCMIGGSGVTWSIFFIYVAVMR